MLVDLKYLLNKRHITLKYFCEINNIVSYEALCQYCERKNIAVVDKDTFMLALHDVAKDNIQSQVKDDDKKIKSSKRKTQRRSASTARKKSKPRNNS